MRNSIGNILTLTLFGESHGNKIGAVLDGFPAGIQIDEDFLKECLTKRRPSLKGETARVEEDHYEILSGVFHGYSTGAPIAITIENSNTRSKDYDKMKDLARPSHADYVAQMRYKGYQDYRGGGHFSGRITAPIVALGSLAISALKKKGILIGTHILKLKNIEDVPYSNDNIDKEIECVNSKLFPVLSDVEEQMKEVMREAADLGDSVGGILQVGVSHLPVGVGEPWFSSLEGELSKAMFSIGGVKGIEFGLGFGFASLPGSQANDAYEEKAKTRTNNNGGINGGLSNGMPILFNLAVRPTPSISLPQDSVNMKTMENTKLVIEGRHDPAIIRRMSIVITCMTALTLMDLLLVKEGEGYFQD